MLRRPPRRYLEVSGEEGVLRWEYEANRVLLYAPAARAWRVEEGAPTFERNAMYVAELRAFAEACQQTPECASHGPDVTHIPHTLGLPEPLASARQAAAVLVIALAALRASAEGRAIDLTAEQEPVAGWLTSL
jgi:predicted dehydrogenase